MSALEAPASPPEVIVRWVGPSVVVETECEHSPSVIGSLICAIHKLDPSLGCLIGQLVKVRTLLAEHVRQQREPSN